MVNGAQTLDRQQIESERSDLQSQIRNLERKRGTATTEALRVGGRGTASQVSAEFQGRINALIERRTALGRVLRQIGPGQAVSREATEEFVSESVEAGLRESERSRRQARGSELRQIQTLEQQLRSGEFTIEEEAEFTIKLSELRRRRGEGERVLSFIREGAERSATLREQELARQEIIPEVREQAFLGGRIEPGEEVGIFQRGVGRVKEFFRPAGEIIQEIRGQEVFQPFDIELVPDKEEKARRGRELVSDIAEFIIPETGRETEIGIKVREFARGLVEAPLLLVGERPGTFAGLLLAGQVIPPISAGIISTAGQIGGATGASIATGGLEITGLTLGAGFLVQRGVEFAEAPTVREKGIVFGTGITEIGLLTISGKPITPPRRFIEERIRLEDFQLDFGLLGRKDLPPSKTLAEQFAGQDVIVFREGDILGKDFFKIEQARARRPPRPLEFEFQPTFEQQRQITRLEKGLDVIEFGKDFAKIREAPKPEALKFFDKPPKELTFQLTKDFFEPLIRQQARFRSGADIVKFQGDVGKIVGVKPPKVPPKSPEFSIDTKALRNQFNRLKSGTDKILAKQVKGQTQLLIEPVQVAKQDVFTIQSPKLTDIQKITLKQITPKQMVELKFDSRVLGFPKQDVKQKQASKQEQEFFDIQFQTEAVITKQLFAPDLRTITKQTQASKQEQRLLGLPKFFQPQAQPQLQLPKQLQTEVFKQPQLFRQPQVQLFGTLQAFRFDQLLGQQLGQQQRGFFDLRTVIKPPVIGGLILERRKRKPTRKKRKGKKPTPRIAPSLTGISRAQFGGIFAPLPKELIKGIGILPGQIRFQPAPIGRDILTGRKIRKKKKTFKKKKKK